MTTYTITSPEWTNNKTGEVNEPRTYYGAELVDTLLANFVPPSDLIKKYYGPDAPQGAFSATNSDRLIFELDGTGNYLVMPNVPRNRGFWKADE